MDRTPGEMIFGLELVVKECGKLILSLKGKNHAVQDKDEQLGNHFSTRADRESLALGLSLFKELNLGGIVIAEEQRPNHVGPVPDDCIVFDPLDGTTNWFNGGEDFGVTACVFRGGRPVYGATFFPIRDLLISAVKDKGCYLGGFHHGKRIKKIPYHGIVKKMQIGTDVGSWTHKAKTFNSVLKPLSKRFTILSSMAAIEGARKVLFGQTVAYCNLNSAKIWDAAAMSLAIEEAGGVVLSPNGARMEWDTVNCSWVMAVNQKSAQLVLKHTKHWIERR